MLLRAISMAFCKLGSPTGSSFVRSLSDLSTSCGLPANQRERKHRKWEQYPTRHFTDALANPTAHTNDANLTERILVKPLHDELARVLQRQVEPRRTHVSVHHHHGQIEEEDEMSDDGTSDGRSWCEQSGEHGEEGTWSAG